MRWLGLALLLGCSTEAPRFVGLSGLYTGDWRLDARLREVIQEEVERVGTWRSVSAARVPEGCRQRSDRDCLLAFGRENDATRGVSSRYHGRGAQSSWEVRVYDLKHGELRSVIRRDCFPPCDDGRTERMYREILREILSE